MGAYRQINIGRQAGIEGNCYNQELKIIIVKGRASN